MNNHKQRFVQDKLFILEQDQLLYRKKAMFDTFGSCRQKYKYYFANISSKHRTFILSYQNAILHDEDYQYPTDFCIEIIMNAVDKIQHKYEMNPQRNQQLVLKILFGEEHKPYNNLISAIKFQLSKNKLESTKNSKYKQLSGIWKQMLSLYQPSIISESLINYKWVINHILFSNPISISESYQIFYRLDKLAKQLQPIYGTEIFTNQTTGQLQNMQLYEDKNNKSQQKFSLLINRYDTVEQQLKKYNKISQHIGKQNQVKTSKLGKHSGQLYNSQLKQEQFYDRVYEKEDRNISLDEILKFYYRKEMLQLLGKDNKQSKIVFTRRIKNKLVLDILQQLLQFKTLTNLQYPGINSKNIIFNTRTSKFILKIEPAILQYGINIDLCNFSMPFFRNDKNNTTSNQGISGLQTIISNENYCNQIMMQYAYFTNEKKLSNNFSQLILILQYFDQCTKNTHNYQLNKNIILSHFQQSNLDELITPKMQKQQTWQQLFQQSESKVVINHNEIVDKYRNNLFKLDQYLGYPSLICDQKSIIQYKLFVRIKILDRTKQLLSKLSFHEGQVNLYNKLKVCLNIWIMLTAQKLFVYSRCSYTRQYAMTILKQMNTQIITLNQKFNLESSKLSTGTYAIVINYYNYLNKKIDKTDKTDKQAQQDINQYSNINSLNIINFEQNQKILDKSAQNNFQLLSMKILMLSNRKPEKSLAKYLQIHSSQVKLALKHFFWKLNFIYLVYSMHLRLNQKNIQQFNYRYLPRFSKYFYQVDSFNQKKMQSKFTSYDKSIQVYQIDI